MLPRLNGNCLVQMFSPQVIGVGFNELSAPFNFSRVLLGTGYFPFFGNDTAVSHLAIVNLVTLCSTFPGGWQGFECKQDYGN
jgi:hypothetical protein